VGSEDDDAMPTTSLTAVATGSASELFFFLISFIRRCGTNEEFRSISVVVVLMGSSGTVGGLWHDAESPSGSFLAYGGAVFVSIVEEHTCASC
jgi:hypothetical protein